MNKFMRRLLPAFLVAAMLVLSLAGCATEKKPAEETTAAPQTGTSATSSEAATSASDAPGETTASPSAALPENPVVMEQFARLDGYFGDVLSGNGSLMPAIPSFDLENIAAGVAGTARYDLSIDGLPQIVVGVDAENILLSFPDAYDKVILTNLTELESLFSQVQNPSGSAGASISPEQLAALMEAIAPSLENVGSALSNLLGVAAAYIPEDCLKLSDSGDTHVAEITLSNATLSALFGGMREYLEANPQTVLALGDAVADGAAVLFSELTKLGIDPADLLDGVNPADLTSENISSAIYEALGSGVGNVFGDDAYAVTILLTFSDSAVSFKLTTTEGETACSFELNLEDGIDFTLSALEVLDDEPDSRFDFRLKTGADSFYLTLAVTEGDTISEDTVTDFALMLQITVKNDGQNGSPAEISFLLSLDVDNMPEVLLAQGAVRYSFSSDANGFAFYIDILGDNLISVMGSNLLNYASFSGVAAADGSVILPSGETVALADFLNSPDVNTVLGAFMNSQLVNNIGLLFGEE